MEKVKAFVEANPVLLAKDESAGGAGAEESKGNVEQIDSTVKSGGRGGGKGEEKKAD